MSSERDLPNHHHSVSDGMLSYFGSPLDDVQAIRRWTPPGREFSFAEFSTPSMGGSRPETSPFSQSTERRFTARVSNSFGSASPCFESDQWESSSKQPMLTPSRNFSSRRSFISKPVYPLVFQNPVSDTEAAGLADVSAGSGLNPGESSTSPFWRFSASNLERNFHKTLTDLQKINSFVDPSSSSRREGFRWSNASSYDMGVDGESMDIAEHINLDNRRDLCGESMDIAEHINLDNRRDLCYNSTDDPKCGLCGRLLRQKSPWGSYRIIRSGDMPVTGVLSCNHVFHADCLDQTTPKSHIHDPPCPVCLKTVDGVEPSSSISEPLKMALRSAQRNPGLSILTNDDNSNQPLDQSDGGLRRNQSLSTGRGGGSSLIKYHLKKHFSFKGKAGKDLFGAKVFCQGGSSSSVLPARRSLVGRTKTLSSSKK